MRVLICGDRNWTDRKTIEDYIKTLPKGTQIIEGECRGVDIIAREIAQKYGLEVYEFPADWSRLGKAAGPIRNKAMIKYGKPDIVIAFHNNIEQSKGTKNMLKCAKKHGIPTRVISSQDA